MRGHPQLSSSKRHTSKHTMHQHVSSLGIQRGSTSCGSRSSCSRPSKLAITAQAQPSSLPSPIATSPAPVTPHRSPVLPDSPILLFGNQRVHSTTRRGMEVIQGMSGWASKELGRYLKPSDRCWQPSDFLPDPSSDTFLDEVGQWNGSARLGRHSCPCVTWDFTSRALTKGHHDSVAMKSNFKKSYA